MVEREAVMNTRNLLIMAIVALICVSLVRPSLSAQERNPDSQAPLTKVADVPLPGPAVRFDYQSLDPSQGRLYIAHMNANQLVVFDVRARSVVASLDGFARVHGVWAVPELGKVYASVTGDHQVAAVDMNSLKIIARIGPVNYPDGLAYAPRPKRIFVSDEHGDVDAVIDTATNKLLKSIPLGGGAGNTVYDAGSGHILVAVHGRNEMVAIDPSKAEIIGHYPLPGIENPHGISLDVKERLAFIAGEENHSLAVFDLTTMKVLSKHEVGEDPDVLAFDPGLKLLYVSAESGQVTVFREIGKTLKQEGSFSVPHAHTVCVDPDTHLVYLPLENIDGHPLLRIMMPHQK
jgi:DNA-binding beta-propeller fold protein YncE